MAELLIRCIDVFMLPASLAPSFDDPIGLLLACHDNVRRFCALLGKIETHVQSHGLDGEAAAAAAQVLRYFEQAAPRHHEDEVLDLFPALHALGNATLNANMAILEREHGELAELWCELRPWLEAVRRQGTALRPAALDTFAARYLAHAAAEEALIYPASVHLSPATLQQLGWQMAQRRGAATPVQSSA